MSPEDDADDYWPDMAATLLYSSSYISIQMNIVWDFFMAFLLCIFVNMSCYEKSICHLAPSNLHYNVVIQLSPVVSYIILLTFVITLVPSCMSCFTLVFIILLIRSGQVWEYTPEQRIAASTLRRYSFGLRLAIAQADARPVFLR